MEKDEFDQLLDEAEKQFFHSSQVDKQKSNNNTKFTSSIDDLMDNVFDELLPNIDDESQLTTPLCDKEEKDFNNKCFPVLLVGTSMPMGLSTRNDQRGCDKMRCTSCDFHVIWFNDYRWSESCDYYFLRNNVPNYNKLKEKLVRSKGYRSYTCQCSWKSVNEIAQVPRTIKWICTKHVAS